MPEDRIIREGREQRQAQEFAQTVSDFVNSSNTETIRLAAKYLTMTLHRTLQQGLFRDLILPAIWIWAKNHADDNFDARNEETCSLSAKIAAGFPNDMPYLPYI